MILGTIPFYKIFRHFGSFGLAEVISVQHISILVCCFLIQADLNLFILEKSFDKIFKDRESMVLFKVFPKNPEQNLQQFWFWREVSLKMMVELDILSY